jgi:HSP20 family molecular chaperone IbpA
LGISLPRYDPEFKEKEQRIKKKVKNIELPKTDSKKFSGLPKKDPKIDRRRLSDKVVYEIEIPGVKSLKDISIVQLENSIEIKALTKNHVFHKILPVNLPIKKYNLSRGTLTLELDVGE